MTAAERQRSGDSALHVLREAKVAALLADTDPGQGRYEASGVVAAEGALWVIFDNIPTIARLHPSLQPGHPDNRILHPQHGADVEDIAYDPLRRRWYTLVEASPVRHDIYEAQVYEFAHDFTLLRTGRLHKRLPTVNKGMEGLTCVRRDDRVYLLALCEGNRCRAGRAGRRPGGGRVHVFEESHRGWQRVCTMNLPPSVEFIDYSGLTVVKNRIAVVSQESSALWVGRLAADRWAVVDGGATYLFPRNQKGHVRYGTIEGVSWLDDRTLAVVSDCAKPDQPSRMRAVAESVHIVELPDPPA